MFGKKTDRNYKPKVYINPKDEKHAYDLVSLGRKYPNWSDTDSIIKTAELFFRNGEPYKNILKSIKQDIDNMQTIRNAIVHMSKESKNKFESLVRDNFRYFPANITAGEFLSKFKSESNSKKLTYITYFRKRLEFASNKIVR